MSGVYPDVPGPRMAWDRDGSVGFYYWTGNNLVSALSAAQKRAFNDESDSYFQVPDRGGDYGVWYVGVIFPELRDLVAFYAGFTSAGSPADFSTSVDSTNGFDGTWVSGVNPFTNQSPVSPSYRSGITSLARSGIKAVRLGIQLGWSFQDPRIQSLHLYGSIHAGANPDRLRLWDPALDQEVDGAFFDWDDIAQGSSLDRTFRVKNNSATKTAHGIGISSEVLTDAGVPLGAQYTYSIGGGAFATSINIGDLAPGAISGVITVRRTTPAAADLSIWALRTIAAAASFT